MKFLLQDTMICIANYTNFTDLISGFLLIDKNSYSLLKDHKYIIKRKRKIQNCIVHIALYHTERVIRMFNVTELNYMIKKIENTRKIDDIYDKCLEVIKIFEECCNSDSPINENSYNMELCENVHYVLHQLKNEKNLH